MWVGYGAETSGPALACAVVFSVPALISVRDENRFGEQIIQSPAVGFLTKSRLSATALSEFADRADQRRGERDSPRGQAP